MKSRKSDLSLYLFREREGWQKPFRVETGEKEACNQAWH